MPNFSSTLTIDSLFWFTSLEPDEQGVTRRIQEDLIPYLDSIDLRYKAFEPKTAAQLLGILNQIASKATAGLRPILHFDTHGNIEDGIRLSGSGEFVSWPDLVASFRAINVATGNNLCVVSGACYSMNAVWQVDLTKPCPFFILIAPENDVSSGFLEDNIIAFYRSLFEECEVTLAYQRHLAPELAIFHCERMLAYKIEAYIRKYCMGKGGDERREELLTRGVKEGFVRNRNEMRKLRKAAKVRMRPDQGMVDRYANGLASTFLMGKSPGFDINDVIRLMAKDAPSKGA